MITKICVLIVYAYLGIGFWGTLSKFADNVSCFKAYVLLIHYKTLKYGQRSKQITQ